MIDTKDYIKEVSKNTNNVGLYGKTSSTTIDKIFLLSPKECGVEWQMTHEDYWNKQNYIGIDALNNEGTKYVWFNNNTIEHKLRLRSPRSCNDHHFFGCDNGTLTHVGAIDVSSVNPAFVIG